MRDDPFFLRQLLSLAIQYTAAMEKCDLMVCFLLPVPFLLLSVRIRQ